MLEMILNNLHESGWKIVALEGGWICATHSTQRRGLFLGSLSELPQEFNPWLNNFAEIVRWDVIVFCTEGVDSSHLKQYRFSNVQLWYWDTQRGNIFPYPPSNDQVIPKWLSQLASGKTVYLGTASQGGRHFTPFFTYSILAINLIVFLSMTFAGGSTNQQVLIAFGAKVNSLIQAGQVWRFLTSSFIHIGFVHLAFNLYALWALGPLTEESFGHRSFLMIYILSGLGGAVASFVFSTALSAGASGAIFGLLGALLSFSYKRPSLWKSGLGMNLIIVILVNLGFGFLQPGIDNFAHVGGLLTGGLTSKLTKK